MDGFPRPWAGGCQGPGAYPRLAKAPTYLVGECLHFDGVPGHGLARAVRGLHQHLLPQLGQAALYHTANTQAPVVSPASPVKPIPRCTQSPPAARPKGSH